MDSNIPDIKVMVGNVNITLNMKRHRKNLQKAQFELDTMVMQDMIPYMPMQTGTFIDRTNIVSQSEAGTGTVCAGATPQGRYLYEGILMIGEESGSAYAKLGEKKVVTDKPLTYANDRDSHWFERAKEVNEKHWIHEVKKAARGR